MLPHVFTVDTRQRETLAVAGVAGAAEKLLLDQMFPLKRRPGSVQRRRRPPPSAALRTLRDAHETEAQSLRSDAKGDGDRREAPRQAGEEEEEEDVEVEGSEGQTEMLLIRSAAPPPRPAGPNWRRLAGKQHRISCY